MSTPELNFKHVSGDVMRVLIVGCGGYIGSHLLDRLLADPQIRLTGWDPNTAKIMNHLSNPNFRLHQTMLSSENELRAFRQEARSSDVVINLAAICNPSEYNTNPLSVMRSNFMEPSRIVDICAEENTWLIHFSTSEVYGRTLQSYVDDTSYDDPSLFEFEEDTTPLIMGPVRNQRWSYASSKQLMERYVYAHHKQNGLPFTIVRPLNFFGPRMDFIPKRDGDGVPRVLACFMAALLDRKPLQLVDGGHARRTIVSIHDAIDAIESMIRNRGKAENRIFNIGNRDNEVSMAQLADLMIETFISVSGDETYRTHPVENVSGQQFYGEGYEDCDRRMPNIDAARTLLGWEPKTALRDILTETVAYYFDLYGRNSSDSHASPVDVPEPAAMR
ncbi:NAD-dependent epimerase/dehydratase family protein [Roseovarius ramblicola]|uniref:NAD-dependent epimerase/dehydratase family protein n=1 Tax=Roseovarius ramblicola TaxID=2022336 RepID=A0ABV5HX13_9RHOB